MTQSKKVLLTQDGMAADLCGYVRLRYRKHTFTWGYIGAWICLTAAAVMFALLFSAWAMLAPVLAAIPLIACKLWWGCRYRRICRSIRAGGYSVTSETLTAIHQTLRYETGRTDGCFTPCFYCFGGEDYHVPISRYAWVNRAEISDYDLYRDPEIGDAFWVVRDTETQEIDAVYNQKIFDYKP